MINISDNINEVMEEISVSIETINSDEEYLKMIYELVGKLIKKFIEDCRKNPEMLKEISLARGDLFEKIFGLYLKFGTKPIAPILIKEMGREKTHGGIFINLTIEGGVVRSFDLISGFFSPPLHLTSILIVYYAFSIVEHILKNIK